MSVLSGWGFAECCTFRGRGFADECVCLVGGASLMSECVCV